MTQDKERELPDLGPAIAWLKSGRSIQEAITELELCARKIEAACRAPVVPQGWRLAPLEHTEAMRATFEAQQGTSTYFTNTTTRIGDFGERYRAMLAAAPQPPEASGHPPFEMEDGAVAVPPADPTMARFLSTT